MVGFDPAAAELWENNASQKYRAKCDRANPQGSSERLFSGKGSNVHRAKRVQLFCGRQEQGLPS